MKIQEWEARYLEVEEILQEDQDPVSLPQFQVRDMDKIENAALDLRRLWNLGNDAIENLMGLLRKNFFQNLGELIIVADKFMLYNMSAPIVLRLHIPIPTRPALVGTQSQSQVK